MIRRLATIIVILSVLAAAAWADGPAKYPALVSGKVFLDANANGKLDAGERGVPAVRVTDGVTFATTGPDGSYRLNLTPDIMLPVPGTQVVALCWPTGKWPTSKHWGRVKDMGDPATMNFGLKEAAGQTLPFYYLHVTDNHDWRASQYEHQHEMVNKVLRDAVFIVNTGDMAFGGVDKAGMEQSAARLKRHRAKCYMPTFGTIGNHDTDSRPCEEYNFCGGYAALLGPLRFSFDYAGIHFAFVDVIADKKEWNDFAAAWLEKDFAALKPGTRIVLSYHYPNPGSSARFKKVLRDYKVKLVHAGHSHAYTRWRDNWVVPMVTAFARSSGTAGVNVVDTDGIHIAIYCDGCSRGSHNFKHSRRCPTGWRTHFLEGQLRALTAKTHTLEAAKLSGQGKTTAVATKYLYASAVLDPGSAGRVGMRIGASPKPFDVVYTGRHIEVDGVAFPFLLPEGEKALRVQVFAHKDMVTVYANNSFVAEKPRAMKQAGSAIPLAVGGEATLVSMTLQEIRPEPDNRNPSYFCSCAHGAVMRNPE